MRLANYDPALNPDEFFELCRCDCSDCRCNSAEQYAKVRNWRAGAKGGARILHQRRGGSFEKEKDSRTGRTAAHAMHFARTSCIAC